jgi:hypothetical protein
MYISMSDETVSLAQVGDVLKRVAETHDSMRGKRRFRWAMLLRRLDDAERLTTVMMWLSPEQAAAVPLMGGSRGYDVATARGSMTPATHVALVDWQVEEADATRFTNRWNAVYHAIEDRIGSRLLHDLDAPSMYAGLHAVTDEANLNPEALAAAVTDAEGLSVSPAAVHRYEVLRLTEA